ncbi:MAG: serine/threonine protein kinase, partial [Planctomycetota bacterium]
MAREGGPSFPRSLPLRYRFERFLSRGAEAATMVVFDAGLRRSRAVVKCQRLAGPDGASSAEGSFRGFCSHLQGVRHPNVATPYTYGSFRDADGVLYGYTTRGFVPGVSLSEIGKPLAEDALLHCAIQIGRGLDALHSRGLQHGDLKPENVIIRRSSNGQIDELSQCVIIDLTHRSPAQAVSSTLTDVSLQYAAPELTAGSGFDVRSDLFSLGVLLYVLGTARRPYGGSSATDIIRSQRARQFTPLGELNRDLDLQLVETIEHLLDPHPENRPDSAGAVQALLDECRERLDHGQVAVDRHGAAELVAS